MNLFFPWMILAVSVLITIWLNLIQKVHVDLVIGILSARENFVQRSILRREILKQYTNLSVILKFIVSAEPCTFPLEERLDVYSCEPLYYSSSTEVSCSHEIIKQGEVFVHTKSIGWDFVVLQDITIEELGFIDFEENGIKGAVKVSIFDQFSKEPVLAAVFMSFSPGRLHDHFRYKPVMNFTMIHGFKGTIVVEGVTKDDPMLVNSHCKINSGNGLLQIQKGFRFGKNNGEFPESLNEHIEDPCFYIGPTLKFRSNVIVDTEHKQNLYSQYANKLKMQSKQLNFEFHEYQDIVLVDVKESYRNLPFKMLEFHKWLSSSSSSFSFDFVLKSDDDCFINITAITEDLTMISIHGKNNIWIGNFREYFALDLKGKWAEHYYKSISYPPFACGSGYILSSDIIEWISNNRNYLKTYQGEDTSLGIWMSAIKHKRIQEERFECFQKCKPQMFSLPENSNEQLDCLYANADNKELCNLCLG